MFLFLFVGSIKHAAESDSSDHERAQQVHIGEVHGYTQQACVVALERQLDRRRQ